MRRLVLLGVLILSVASAQNLSEQRLLSDLGAKAYVNNLSQRLLQAGASPGVVNLFLTSGKQAFGY